MPPTDLACIFFFGGMLTVVGEISFGLSGGGRGVDEMGVFDGYGATS